MYREPTREDIQRIKEQYPAGTRIKLGYMNDPDAVPAGTTGTVFLVDSIGQIHVKWDNGRTLPVVWGVDSFCICTEKARAKNVPPKSNKTYHQDR